MTLLAQDMVEVNNELNFNVAPHKECHTCGGTKTVEVPSKKVPCTNCKTTNPKKGDGFKWVSCTKCEGTGKYKGFIPCLNCKSTGKVKSRCPVCHGDGLVDTPSINVPCMSCHGDGFVEIKVWNPVFSIGMLNKKV